MRVTRMIRDKAHKVVWKYDAHCSVCDFDATLYVRYQIGKEPPKVFDTVCPIHGCLGEVRSRRVRGPMVE